MGDVVEDAFYEKLDEAGRRFASRRTTVGPWSPTLQHGGPPAALLGGLFERYVAAPDGATGGRLATTSPRGSALRVARLSLDFFSPVPVAELAIDVDVPRPGAKIELVTATVRVVEGGAAAARPVLRASAWRIATEAGRSTPRNVDTPSPPLPPPGAPLRFFPGVDECPYADALEWRFVTGGYESIGPSIVWARPRVAIVQGEPVSPLQRLLAMVDSANGVSAELPIASWTFVPVNLTVVVHRHPEGEWVGMDARTSIGDAGVGLTEARLFDARGDVGRAVQTLFVAPR